MLLTSASPQRGHSQNIQAGERQQENPGVSQTATDRDGTGMNQDACGSRQQRVELSSGS